MNERPEFQEILGRLRAITPELRSRYGIQTLEVFGSWVHGDASPESDLDLLVTFRKNPGLIQLGEIQYAISDALGRKVDLVLRDSLKPRLRPSILDHAIAV